jgi:hypothetical protein
VLGETERQRPRERDVFAQMSLAAASKRARLGRRFIEAAVRRRDAACLASPASKPARTGRGAIAFVLPPARTALLQRHGRSTAGWRFLALEAVAAAPDDCSPRKEYRDLTTEAVANHSSSEGNGRDRGVTEQSCWRPRREGEAIPVVVIEGAYLSRLGRGASERVVSGLLRR